MTSPPRPGAGAHDGGCFCGAVRYRLHGPPMFTQACHCRDCQRQTGGPFAINTLIEADRVERLQGDPAPVAMRTDSGRPHVIWRCDACRTAVWSTYSAGPKLRFVRVATLDDPTVLEPEVHIFTRTRLPWLPLPSDRPAVEVYYDMQALWPAESLERRRALFAGG